MKKLILALIMVCLLAISVSAYKFGNSTINFSDPNLVLYDNFDDRFTSSPDLGSAVTMQDWWQDYYGGGWNDSNEAYVSDGTFIAYNPWDWQYGQIAGYEGITIASSYDTDVYTFEFDWLDQYPTNYSVVDLFLIDRIESLSSIQQVVVFLVGNGSLNCYNGAGTSDYTNFTINDGQWHHWRLTTNVTSDEFWVYVDDMLVCNMNSTDAGDVTAPNGNEGDIEFLFMTTGDASPEPDEQNRTQLMDDLYGWYGFGMMPEENKTWCYQEFANQSVCGKQKAGYVWYDDPLLFDGDWGTYTNSVDTIGAVYYHRPENATNDSQWQIKDENGIYNLSIPDECWSATALLFVSANSGGQSDWSCLDDMWNFYPLYQSSSSGAENRYEEAMWWDVSEGSCEPDWVCNGYGYCLLNSTQPCISASDSNDCGLTYSGDYSEFTPQPCIYDGCYQEFSTIGTDCGGVANPNNWTQGGAWDGGGIPSQTADKCVDGDWDSSCCSYSASWVEENFTKPTGAYGAVWVTYGGVIVNDTIPQSCWDAYPDNLLVRDYSDGDYGSNFRCWNGTDWKVVRQWSYLSRCLYEEGMYWAINCTPDWYCNGWESCINGTQGCNSTLDLNICGQAYQGNYSEFNPQSCGTPTGYVPTYDSGDLSKLTIDTFGQALLELLELVGVVVVVVIVVVGAKGLKKVIK